MGRLFFPCTPEMVTSAEQSGGQPGTILEATGGVYRIQIDGAGEIEASLRGRLRHVSDVPYRVVAGDHVTVSCALPSGGWTIDKVRPRQNQFVRAAPGGRRPKVVAANIDRAIVVFSALEPTFDPRAADRFLVLAEACGIPPLMVLNKMDLPGAAAVAEGIVPTYDSVGYEALTVSARTGEGLGRLSGLFEKGISAMVGPSGAGKSSLMNALFPGLNLRTREVTTRGGRGRHTTVGSRLIPLPTGGWVADTPGFSDVSLWGVSSAQLSHAFPEFRGLAEGCRFSGCSHSHEPDCAVLDAVEDGRIWGGRYESYLALLAEC